jgi:Domain of unknown function (DUF4167)
MNTTSELKPAAAQPRPKMKNMTHAMPRNSRFRKTEPSGFRRSNAKPVQNAQRNYQRYLELARAETLSGDRIAAENYFQHAEHYLRSMGEDSN